MSRADLSGMEGFDPELFMSYASRLGHGGALGIAYHAHGADWVELALPYDEKLIGVAESGVIASGPIISLMDMATSLAIWVKLDRFRHQATLDMRVDYLRPATPGQDDHRPRRMLCGDQERRLRARESPMTATSTIPSPMSPPPSCSPSP